MRITVAASRENELVIDSVCLSSRPMAEKWINAVQKQVEILWPAQKSEVQK